MLLYQVQGFEERFLNFIGVVYESIVISITIVILVLIYLRYREKRHEFTLYLLIIFIFYLLAICFSLITKIFIVLQFDKIVDGYTLFGQIFYRILSFRVSEFIICFAIILSYVLKIKLFHDDYNPTYKYLVITFGSITAFFDLVMYRYKDDSFSVLLDTIAFLLTFIFMAMIYFPFFYRSIEASRVVENPQYKTAFTFLGVMSICYILVFLNFFLDRLCMLIFDVLGFTPFYYAAWASGIVAVLCAYFGYIRPRSSRSN